MDTAELAELTKTIAARRIGATSPGEAPPVESPPGETPPAEGARKIGDRWILRLDGRDGWPCWRQLIRRQIPTYESFPHGGGRAGHVERVEVAYEWGGDPAEVIQRLFESVNFRPFDPRPENKLADQLERGRQEGFSELCEAFELTAKVKPRVPFPALWGRVWISHGVTSVLYLGREPTLTFLNRHIRGDWGANGKASEVELSDDQLWAGPVISQAVANQAAVLAGRGLVQSTYVEKLVPTRGPEELKICTFLGHTTVIFSPRMDVC
jgi:hypothetical protein